MPTYEQLIEKAIEKEATVKREREAEELKNRPIPELSVDSILSKGYLEETPQDIEFLMSIPEEQLSKLPLKTQHKIEVVLKIAADKYEELVAIRAANRPRLEKAKKLLENLDKQPSDLPSDTQEILPYFSIK